MLKAALIFLAVTAGSTLAVVTGNTVYSAFQFQLFPGSGLKVMQDPANVWSWHKDIFSQSAGNHFEDVLVDFDNNNHLDTEYADLRVIITDVQVRGTSNLNSAWLVSGGIRLWQIYDFTSSGSFTRSHHFSTPLVLTVNSDFKIETETNSNPAANEVHLIGRVVTL